MANLETIKEAVLSSLGEKDEFKDFLKNYAEATNDGTLRFLLSRYDEERLVLEKPVVDDPMVVVQLMLRHFLDDNDDLFSERKVHCMLYILQGYFMAYFGKPLFTEEFKKWHTLPVLGSVYKWFSKNSKSLESLVLYPPCNEACYAHGKPHQIEVVDDPCAFFTEMELSSMMNIFDNYSKYTAHHLSRYIRGLESFEEAGDCGEKTVISRGAMRKDFLKLVETQEKH